MGKSQLLGVLPVDFVPSVLKRATSKAHFAQKRFQGEQMLDPGMWCGAYLRGGFAQWLRPSPRGSESGGSQEKPDGRKIVSEPCPVCSSC